MSTTPLPLILMTFLDVTHFSSEPVIAFLFSIRHDLFTFSELDSNLVLSPCWSHPLHLLFSLTPPTHKTRSTTTNTNHPHQTSYIHIERLSKSQPTRTQKCPPRSPPPPPLSPKQKATSSPAPTTASSSVRPPQLPPLLQPHSTPHHPLSPY